MNDELRRTFESGMIVQTPSIEALGPELVNRMHKNVQVECTGGARRGAQHPGGLVVTPWPGTTIRDGAMSSGTHLTLEERGQLAVLKAEGLSLSTPPVISPEVPR